MPELNKATSQGDVSVVSTMAACICVCVCLIFTEKRHTDLLDAGYAVAS
ncbi:MAG: hypothetical protein FWG90_07335 [Oscillospiraceae bacterium]|nr:hypothetical protein [Oscillospiraceae bacterium]